MTLVSPDVGLPDSKKTYTVKYLVCRREKI